MTQNLTYREYLDSKWWLMVVFVMISLIFFLISSHDLNPITEVCDTIVLLEKGVLMKDLTTDSDTFAELEAYFKA